MHNFLQSERHGLCGDKLSLDILLVGTDLMVLVLSVCSYPCLQAEQASAGKKQAQKHILNIYRCYLSLLVFVVNLRAVVLVWESFDKLY